MTSTKRVQKLRDESKGRRFDVTLSDQSAGIVRHLSHTLGVPVNAVFEKLVGDYQRTHGALIGAQMDMFSAARREGDTAQSERSDDEHFAVD